MPTALLAFGSNTGDKYCNIHAAIDALVADGRMTLVRCSSMVESEPWGYDSPNSYANAVASFATDLAPMELLALTEQTERLLGRSAKTRRHPVTGAPLYSDRPIDIDILALGDTVMQTERLTIPHPRLRQRPFVTAPLSEIMPDWDAVIPRQPATGERQ